MRLKAAHHGTLSTNVIYNRTINYTVLCLIHFTHQSDQVFSLRSVAILEGSPVQDEQMGPPWSDLPGDLEYNRRK